MATGNLIPAYVNVLEIKRDIATLRGRRSDVPTYIQLVYLGNVKHAAG